MSDELLSAFIVEGRELTDQAAAALQALQAAKDDWPALDQLFRAFHTLKGSAGLMGFEAMTALFHVAEDRLGEARAAGVGLDPALAQTLLAVLDQTEAWLDDAEAAERLPADADVAALMATLGIAAASVETTASGDEAPAWSASLLGDTPPDPGRYVAIRYAPAEDAYLKGEDPAAVMEGLPGLVRLQIAPRTPFSDLPAYDPFACNLVFTALSQAAEAQVREALKLAAGQVEIASLTVADEARAADAGPLRTLRVESARMDELAAATDDLAVIKNRLAHLLAETGRQVEPALGRELAKAQSDLEHRVSRLHDAVSRLRTTPLAPVFRRFPRLVRETSAALGKEVALSLEGSDVELDKTLVDALFEPLLHLVRNALDHGIETPDQRRALGKPVPAKLRIIARTMGRRGGDRGGRRWPRGRSRQSPRGRGRAGRDSRGCAGGSFGRRRARPDLRAGLLDREGGGRPFRQGRGPGCGEDCGRGARRAGRGGERAGDRFAADDRPAAAGAHGADHDGPCRPGDLRRAAGSGGRDRAGEGRQRDARPRGPRLRLARPAAAIAQPRNPAQPAGAGATSGDPGADRQRRR